MHVSMDLPSHQLNIQKQLANNHGNQMDGFKQLLDNAKKSASGQEIVRFKHEHVQNKWILASLFRDTSDDGKHVGPSTAQPSDGPKALNATYTKNNRTHQRKHKTAQLHNRCTTTKTRKHTNTNTRKHIHTHKRTHASTQTPYINPITNTNNTDTTTNTRTIRT